MRGSMPKTVYLALVYKYIWTVHESHPPGVTMATISRCRGLSHPLPWPFVPPTSRVAAVHSARTARCSPIRPHRSAARVYTQSARRGLRCGALANDTRLPTEDVRAERAPRAALRASALRRIFAKLLAKLPSFTHQRLSSLTLK